VRFETPLALSCVTGGVWVSGMGFLLFYGNGGLVGYGDRVDGITVRIIHRILKDGDRMYFTKYKDLYIY
jgi:hypothetical protein